MLAVREIVHRVPHQAGITVAGLVEGLQHGFAVVLVFFFLELLGLEEIVPLVGVGFLHVLGQAILLHMLVTGEVDVLNAHLGAFVHVEIHAHGAADHGIPDGLDVHVHLEESLFLIIALDNVYGSILHIV